MTPAGLTLRDTCHLRSKARKVLITICTFIAFSAGCASSKPAEELAPQGSVGVVQREIQKRPYQMMTSEDVKLSGKPAVHVRLASESEVYAVPRFVNTKTGGGMAAIGAGGLALGFVAPPLYASSLIVGGVLVTSMTATLAAVEKRQITTIEKVITSVDLRALVQEAIEARLNGRPDGNADGIKLTVLILGYGFTKKYPEGGPEELCFTMDAEILFSVGDEEIYRDFVFMEPHLRSEDAPPPPCARMGDLADNEGRLGREMLIEQSEILSAIVAHRLSALPWKDW
jgi:hypothetical protein